MAILDRIKAENASVDLGKIAQSIVLSVPYALGYVARWVFRGISLAIAAVKAGWRTGGDD